MKKMLIVLISLFVFIAVALSIYFLFLHERVATGRKSALFVIDIQNAQFPIHKQEQVLANVALLVKRANDAGIPVIYIQQTDDRKGSPFEKGSSGWQMHDSIRPRVEYLSVLKRFGDSFYDTDLSAILSSRGIKTVIITGCATEACVSFTVSGAKTKGYRVIVVSDAHSTNKNASEKTIDNFNRTCAQDSQIILARAADIYF